MKSLSSVSSPRTRMSLVHIAVRALCSSGAVLPFASAHAEGPAPAAAEPAQATTSSKSDAVLEEVVVSGIRLSLQQSMDLKQNADQLVDAITAQDLGQFPDSDVADSLSHIPGVAIDRDETGAGSEVT